MNQEDALDFMQKRLRHPPGGGQLRLRRPRRVKRRFAVEMPGGSLRRFDRVDGSVMVRCSSGSLWITHDGDPKDVILASEESYRAERDAAMNMFALQPCVLEIEFEDDVLPA